MLGCGVEKPAAVVEAEATLPEQVDFNFHIKPILSDRCFACHGPDDNARKADLRLDTPEGAFAALAESGNRAIVPGKLRRSEAYHRLVSEDPEEQMPPPESNLSVTPREIALISRWIEQGAEYTRHWAFLTPAKPSIPNVQNTAWVSNDIDPFILARLETEGLAPQEAAAKETLLRRVTFDLTGLPPTLDEIDTFLADNSPDAYEKVVDRLLASGHYGERMAIEWLDVARYADSHGYQDDGLRTMWPWRDWVIKAFNENLPYDDFLTWQLAGDLLPNPTRDQMIATGFNRNHMQSQEGGIVEEEYRVEYVADRTHTVGKAFMGLTMECARCHDHKYDPITQKEYYGLFAFFNNNIESGVVPYVGEASPTIPLLTPEAETELQDIEAQIDALKPLFDAQHTTYDDAFETWLANQQAAPEQADGTPDGLIGDYPLDELRPPNADDVRNFDNLAASNADGYFWGDVDKLPIQVEGRFGNALKLQGESWLDMGKDRYFYERTDAFSIGIWFNIVDSSASGPLFARSGSLFNGKRGYLVELLDDGRFSASLNHVFPANSLEIQTTTPVPIQTWNHLMLTYDGSSRAEGLRLYLNGEQAETDIKVDNLSRSLLKALNHEGKLTNWGGGGNLSIGWLGANSPTLDSVSVDAFKVFDRRLTDLEVAHVFGRTDTLQTLLSASTLTSAQQAVLRDYYVTTQNRDYQRTADELKTVWNAENDLLTEQTSVMVMKEMPEPRETYVLDRGAYDSPTDRIGYMTPEAVFDFPPNLPQNRLGLAQWLTDPQNPLTARVIVNRYWQMLFGTGLVGTPDDFGSQGALPSHPELLDWLATSFIEMDWDTKAFLKMLVMSSTYQQSSRVTPELLELDPNNELLARGPSGRLNAEMIRDNALAVSGLLVDRIGGPSVRPYQPEGLWKELATRNATEYVQDTGDKLYRRSLYTIWKRTTPPPSMMSFDASERNFCTVQRQSTNTPQQALVLLNDPQYVEASRVLAQRLLTEGGDTLQQQLAYGFRLLTSREPEPAELDLLASLYEAENEVFTNDPQAARDLVRVGDYPVPPSLAATDVASLAIVANTLLNFDEAVIKR